jgi:hypothetical protein
MPDPNVRYVAALELGAESAVVLVATATTAAATTDREMRATRFNIDCSEASLGFPAHARF